MDSPTTTSIFKNALPAAAVTTWNDCIKFLKELPLPVPEQDRETLVSRIRSSRDWSQIAFDGLWNLLSCRADPRLGWLEAPLIALLGGGSEEPRLAAKSVPSEAAAWVFQELRDVRTMEDWRAFAASGRHLWVIYAILKSFPNRTACVESLVALAECLESCQNASSPGKRKRPNLCADDSKWIAKLIRSRVSPGAEPTKAFLEGLFAVNATAILSAELRQETSEVLERLKKTTEALEAANCAREEASRQIQELQHKVQEASEAFETCKAELQEERRHSTRQGGFDKVARQETINHVLSIVRKGIIHRIDNIRVYADRANPNGEEIVALVKEIERHLARMEEAVDQ